LRNATPTQFKNQFGRIKGADFEEDWGGEVEAVLLLLEQVSESEAEQD